MTANDNDFIVGRLRKAAHELYDVRQQYREHKFWRLGSGMAEMALLILDAADEIERLQAMLDRVDDHVS